MRSFPYLLRKVSALYITQVKKAHTEAAKASHRSDADYTLSICRAVQIRSFGCAPLAMWGYNLCAI